MKRHPLVIAAAMGTVTLTATAFAQGYLNPAVGQRISAEAWTCHLRNPVANEYRETAFGVDARERSATKLKLYLKDSVVALESVLDRTASAEERKLGESVLIELRGLLRQTDELLARGAATSCGETYWTYCNDSTAPKGSPASNRSQAALQQLPRCNAAMVKLMADADRTSEKIRECGQKLKAASPVVDAPPPATGSNLKGDLQQVEAASRAVAAPPSAGGDLKEDLQQGDILEVVSGNKAALVQCSEDQKNREPGTSGRLVMKWSIHTSGKVSNVVVVTEEFKGTYIAGCIGGVIKAMTFPRHKTAGEPVQFPFKFGGRAGGGDLKEDLKQGEPKTEEPKATTATNKPTTNTKTKNEDDPEDWL